MPIMRIDQTMPSLVSSWSKSRNVRGRIIKNMAESPNTLEPAFRIVLIALIFIEKGYILAQPDERVAAFDWRYLSLEFSLIPRLTRGLVL
jgi:hypothetical protein